MKLNEIRLLPREVPRDPLHEFLIEGLLNGSLSQESFMNGFMIPGAGFHSSLYILTLHLAEYRVAGRHTFVIPEEMQKALVRTSLEGVRPEDLEFPFRSQYVALPNFGAEIWGGERTGWHKVGGVLLRYIKGEKRVHATGKVVQPPKDDPGVIYVYIWGLENEKSTNAGDDASLWMAVDLDEMRSSGMDVETYLWNMLSDPTRKETLHGVEEVLIADSPGSLTIMPEGKEGDKVKQGAIDTLRVVFNSLLYMGSEGAEMELDPSLSEAEKERVEITLQIDRIKNPSKKKAKYLKKKLDSLPKDVVTWVGKSFSNQIAGEVTHGIGSPQRRHWVRGHWWPRRDTIQRRVQEAAKDLENSKVNYEEFKSGLGGIKDHGKALSLLNEMGEFKKRIAESQENLENLKQSVNCKKRWVKPYQKGSVGELPENHTYKL
jgi:hypothetical protein